MYIFLISLKLDDNFWSFYQYYFSKNHMPTKQTSIVPSKKKKKELSNIVD